MENIENIIQYSQKLTLLYVEDNKEARDATKMIFDEFFGEVIIAVDGEDGLQKYKEHNNKINLIISDINMPKLDGIQMIEKIRETDKKIPILVISAYSKAEFILKSINLGVCDYILKPLEIEQFLKVLERIIKDIHV